MRGKFVLNGLDFSGLVEREGIQQSVIERASQEIETRDGVLHKSAIYKRQYSVSFVEMPETRLMDIAGAVLQPSSVQILDSALGLITRQFYIDGPQSTQKVVENGITYCNGVSLTLTEV